MACMALVSLAFDSASPLSDGKAPHFKILLDLEYQLAKQIGNYIQVDHEFGTRQGCIKILVLHHRLHSVRNRASSIPYCFIRISHRCNHKIHMSRGASR